MTGLSQEGLRRVLVWLALALLVIPVGGALWLGVAQGESPCILCWAQRTSMLLIALVALFVVRYGPRPRYVGTLVVLGAWGIWMATRHSSLHVARDIGQGFAVGILGAHTYTWAWVVHWLVLVAGGVLLAVTRGPLAPARWESPGRPARFAMVLLVALAGANAVQAFISTGPPPFMGQGDPVRLSLNPSHWVWSTGELAGPVGWRGSWAVAEPEPASLDVDPDPATGPLADLPTLAIASWLEVGAERDGALTGFAVHGDEAVAVTDAYEVLRLDAAGPAALERVRGRVVLDRGFSVDLTTPAGAAWLGPDTVAVLTTNKSYVLLTPDPAADPDREWRHFLETDGTTTELTRSRFSTVRARQRYALSLAWDPAAEELITVAASEAGDRGLVVSRFARSDRLLSREHVVHTGPGVALRPDRVLGEYVVAGAAVVEGRLYALSAAHSTLLVVDLAEGVLTAAYAVPGLDRPVGLAARGDTLLAAQADGRVALLPRP